MISAEQERNIGDVILIETYWNVNFLYHQTGSCTVLILIETYWNVNQFLTAKLNRRRLY